MDANLANQAHALLEEQKRSWPMLARGYESLKQVRRKRFELAGAHVELQFNPGRMASTLAKVDEQSIRQRKCFLCDANRPPEQRAIAAGDYLILANPFPIFPEHFTIAHREHMPQRFGPNLEAFLSLSKALGPRYTVFYNGPRCGASAPDHMHFQAGSLGFMPIEAEYDAIRSNARVLKGAGPVRRFAVTHGRRRFVSFESGDAEALSRTLQFCQDALQAISQESDEPMMNILSTHSNGAWRVLLFPRGRHRPSFYLAEGQDRILLSPAAVEMGGVCTVPLEADFQKVTGEHLLKMYEEVTLAAEAFEQLCAALEQQ